MVKLTVFTAFSLLIGAGLAILSLAGGFSTGWAGALVFLAWAFHITRQWSRRQRTDFSEPSAPERALWIQLAATGLILGHLTAALANTNIDLHVGKGNTIAIDSWMMIAALLIVMMMFRRDFQIKDERDAAIEARGVKIGYAVLISLLIAFMALLVAAPAWTWFTPFWIGNLLVALILTSYAAQIVIRLHGYRPRTELPRRGGDAQ